MRYYEHLARSLKMQLQAEVLCLRIEEALIQAGFNHLAYFAYLQKKVTNGCLPGDFQEYLIAEKGKWISCPESIMMFQPGWCSLKSLMNAWLDEEMALHQKTALKMAVTPKIPLNLSVAQLACIIRMFFDEGYLDDVNLSGLFRFCASHFQTKRQPVISQGSLSKEYYSIDQITAANVRGLLKQMLSRIDKHFFPAWLVIGAAIACY